MKARGGIKKRVTFIIIAATILVLAVSIFLIYFLGLNILKEAIGRQYAQMSGLMLNTAVDLLKGEVEDAEIYATRQLWTDAIKNVNLKYSHMDKKAIDDYMAEMDKKWVSVEKEDPLFLEYLQNRIALNMRDIVATRGTISELFVTDKYGGIVASSGRTSDFYQADEEWWQAAYNGGKGDIYVGNTEFDSSSNRWVMNIAIPMKDRDGTVIGICKECMDIERIFGGFKNFTIGKTGYTLLVNNRGLIIYHRGADSINKEFFTEKEIGRLLAEKKYFTVLPKTKFDNKKMFIAYSATRPQYLTDKDIRWIAFIIQDASEMSKPLDKFVFQLVVVSLLVILLIIPIAMIFGNMIAKPIIDLSEASERIKSGDWDYAVNVKTGDEIEDFARKFNLLMETIKYRQKELIKSKEDFEQLSRSLEVKVAERTSELGDAQAAALNVLEDLTEAKENLERSNRELKKLDQLKSDFISTVSHELRTPLSIIKEGISLILDRIPGDINEKQKNILIISRSNIDRLARIIDDLLDISKIEAGKVELKVQPIDISDIARQVALSFQTKVKEKGLDLKMDIDKVEGKVLADPDKITQVFTNLIGNAIKFTQKGCIQISCKDKDDKVMCSVSDTGIGISKDDLPKVFGKFQQFGRVAGAGEKGTGLGLSIAKGIIDMHHGSIQVKSELGKGTTFTFMLYKHPEAVRKETV